MKRVQIAVLWILIILAVASGAAKVLLMPQDSAFFGKYGFTNFTLIAFGAVQLIGALVMAFRRTRSLGALIVAITFGLSAILLAVDGNVPMAIVTLIATVGLGWISLKSRA